MLLVHTGIEAIPMCIYNICRFNELVFYNKLFKQIFIYFNCFSKMSM